jgi:RND family efflux transporter MFP subunit
MIDAIAKSEGPDKTLLYVLPGQEAWVYADIFEYEIPLVKVGDTLEVEIAALSKKYSGRIRAIDTVVDSKTRTVRVRAVVKNDEGLLKPDLFVNVSLQVNLGSALTVPEEAVFLSGKSALVFVDKGQGLFEPRRVDLGQRAGEVYEIREGLAEGERVITNGNFLVDSESRLKAALSGMTGT